MPILSNLIRGGGGSSTVAQVSLTANTYKSPGLTFNTWTSIPFNTIDVNQDSIITSINPSTSSLDLKSGIYQASFYHSLALDAGSNVVMGKRFFNVTSNSEITRYPQVVYNNYNTPLFPSLYFTADINFELAADSTIALQFFNTRSAQSVSLHYTDAGVNGATIINGINRGYILNLYKLD